MSNLCMKTKESTLSECAKSPLVKFRSDVVGLVNSLGCSKRAFYLVSLADGYLLILCVCIILFLGRSAIGRL